MGPRGCAETSVGNYHYSLSSSPEERSSQPLIWSSLILCNSWGIPRNDRLHENANYGVTNCFRCLNGLHVASISETTNIYYGTLIGLSHSKNTRLRRKNSLRNMALLKHVTPIRQWTNFTWNPVSNDSYIHCASLLNIVSNNNSQLNSILVYNSNSKIVYIHYILQPNYKKITCFMGTE